MPEIKVWEDPESLSPQPLLLRLRQCGDRVELHAVDKEGTRRDQGTLLYFHPDEMGLIPNVDPEFGFTLDAEGYLLARKL